MVDVRDGRYVANPVVIVRGERIDTVGSNLPIPVGAKVVDLGNLTLLPGLIDSHSHLLKNNALHDGPSLILDVTIENTTTRALRAVRMAREDLEAGITTVRDVELGNQGDVALRDAIESGYVIGPRILACTRALSPAGGQFPRLASESQALVEREYVPISGVEEAKKAVRQAIYYGADCIKVIVDAGGLLISPEEMAAIVGEAHRYGKTVAAHATSEAAIKIAADAKVNSIEHGFGLNEELAKLMSANGVFLVPNDYPVEVYLMGIPRTPEQRRESEAGYRGFTRNMRKRLAIAARPHLDRVGRTGGHARASRRSRRTGPRSGGCPGTGAGRPDRSSQLCGTGAPGGRTGTRRGAASAGTAAGTGRRRNAAARQTPVPHSAR